MSLDVYSRSPAQADVSIRGSSAEQTLILVDGARASDAQSAHYALDIGLPLASIERIEILRGPGSALYGPDAVGGVINIVTRRAQRAPEATVRAGSFGTVGAALSGGAAAGNSPVSAAIEYDRSDGHRTGTDYRIGQARIGGTRPLRDGLLTADAALGVRDFGASDFYSPFNSSERTASTTATSRWTGPAGRWALSMGANTRRHTDRFTLKRDDPGYYENRHTSWQTGADAVARVDAGGATVALGVDAMHDQLSSARLGGRREWRAGGFAEATLRNPGGVELDAGVRDDHSSTYGDFFSPSLGIAAPAGKRVTLRANGSRGFRAPTWTDRYYTDPTNVGDPDLRPERFWSGEIGARLAASRSLGLDAAAFVRNATDLIDWVRPATDPTSPWMSRNVGDATSRGAEATVTVMPATNVVVTLSGMGLAFDASRAAGLAGKYALRPVTRQLTGSLRTPIASRGNATVEIVHARRTSERGYSTANLHLGWPLGSARLRVDAINVANADWLDASGAPAAGRSISVGVTWRGQ